MDPMNSVSPEPSFTVTATPTATQTVKKVKTNGGVNEEKNNGNQVPVGPDISQNPGEQRNPCVPILVIPSRPQPHISGEVPADSKPAPKNPSEEKTPEAAESVSIQQSIGPRTYEIFGYEIAVFGSNNSFKYDNQLYWRGPVLKCKKDALIPLEKGSTGEFWMSTSTIKSGTLSEDWMIGGAFFHKGETFQVSPDGVVEGGQKITEQNTGPVKK